MTADFHEIQQSITPDGIRNSTYTSVTSPAVYRGEQQMR